MGQVYPWATKEKILYEMTWEDLIMYWKSVPAEKQQLCFDDDETYINKQELYAMGGGRKGSVVIHK